MVLLLLQVQYRDAVPAAQAALPEDFPNLTVMDTITVCVDRKFLVMIAGPVPSLILRRVSVSGLIPPLAIVLVAIVRTIAHLLLLPRVANGPWTGDNFVVFQEAIHHIGKRGTQLSRSAAKPKRAGFLNV